MFHKTSVLLQIVIASAILVCSDAIRTGPYVQWSTDASKIPSAVLNLIEGHNVPNLLRTVSLFAPSAEHPYSVVLYIEPEMDTQHFLLKTGAYSVEVGDTMHAYLKTIVSNPSMQPMLDNYSPLTSETHVDAAVVALSNTVSTCVVTDENDTMYRFGNKVKLVSSTSLSDLSPTDCFLTVVNLRQISPESAGSMLQTSFQRFSEEQHKAGVGVLGVYAAVVESRIKEVVTERRMQEMDSPTDAEKETAPLPEQYELPIQPYQLSAVITLSFMGLMILLVVTCLTSIDTPKIFEDKAIPINKEY